VVASLHSIRVQRLFSAFPGRWPGVGLVLLRIAVGMTLVAQGAASVTAGVAATPMAVIYSVIAVAIGVALNVGFLTPVAGTAAAVFGLMTALAWLPDGGTVPFDRMVSFFQVIVACAIALLGPGAFSVDSYLFGRREIVIPSEPRPSRLS
jgi:uncharacterized membrane protein YphA (DoxX/SURF4 family)